MTGEELEGQREIVDEGQRKIVEALIVASEEPIGATKLADIVPDCTAAQIRTLVDELNAEYETQNRAFEIWEVAGGFQMRTRPVYAGYILQLQSVRPVRLSKAALETLAIVAYKQPLTRAEIEHIRGVDVGAAVRSLVERGLLRTAGHREVPGRPMLYGTTKEFLELFGFASLKDLPTLRDIQELIAQEAPDAAVTHLNVDSRAAETTQEGSGDLEGDFAAGEADFNAADNAAQVESEVSMPARDAYEDDADTGEAQFAQEDTDLAWSDEPTDEDEGFLGEEEEESGSLSDS